MGEHSVSIVTEADLSELLPLLRAYCDFYRVAPSDEALLALYGSEPRWRRSTS